MPERRAPLAARGSHQGISGLQATAASALRAAPPTLPSTMKRGCNDRNLQEWYLQLQRVVGNCAVQRMQSSASGGMVDAMAEKAIDSARSGGQALDAPIRRTVERYIGSHLGGVRIHTGQHAQILNESIGARAFTTGSDIFFGESQYRPGTVEGDHLLAHELTHVVQRREGRAAVSRACSKCEAEKAQAKIAVGAVDDPREREAGAVADRILQTKQLEGVIAEESGSAETLSGAAPASTVWRVPAPGKDFGTPGYCGFGITTGIPGFIAGRVTNDFDIDYTTGCAFVAANAWSSVWELYDASNNKLDSKSETPFGDYAIPAAMLNKGTPSDGTNSKWSLWYRITRSNPWVTGDNDAYPYNYKTFDVYADPIKDPRTTLSEDKGPVQWQYNYTPAEDGASLDYSFTTSSQRSTSDSQTTSVSGTVSGSNEAHIGFSYDGLTGGFSKNLSYSATASISRTHSVDISANRSDTLAFHSGTLRGGVTYRITARPLYHVISGSVQLIAERDGVVSSLGDRVEGGIRMLKGLDIQIEPSGRGSTEPDLDAQARKWGCTDVRCNCYPVEPGAKCPERVVGNAPYIYGSKDEACKAAQSDANSQVPRGCTKRHCNCNTKCTTK
jgi:hypothetical protein